MALNRLNYKPCGTEIPAWTRATGFITSHGCDIAHRTFFNKIQCSRPTFIKLASRVIYEIRVTFLWNPDLPRYWVAIVLKGIYRYSHYSQMWLYMRLIVFRWSARLKLDIFLATLFVWVWNFWDFVWQTEVSLVLLISLSIIDFPRKKTIIIAHVVLQPWWRHQMEAFSALLVLCEGIPLTKASDAELWCFLWSVPEQTAEQIIETPVIWDAIGLIMTSM